MNNKEVSFLLQKKGIRDNIIFLILTHPILYYKWKKDVKTILKENSKNTVITFWGLIEQKKMEKRVKEYRIKRNRK